MYLNKDTKLAILLNKANKGMYFTTSIQVTLVRVVKI